MKEGNQSILREQTRMQYLLCQKDIQSRRCLPIKGRIGQEQDIITLIGNIIPNTLQWVHGDITLLHIFIHLQWQQWDLLLGTNILHRLQKQREKSLRMYNHRKASKLWKIMEEAQLIWRELAQKPLPEEINGE